MRDPTGRFSDRVADYVKYRPGYPPEVIPHLRAAVGLTPASLVADVGSGTGISARLFLDNGNVVYAVEPNDAMRAAAESMLGHYPTFRSVAATAEDTTLPGDTFDLVVAAQAFHWFDRDAARREFARILQPSGHVVLLWNVRLTDTTAFLRDYEAMLLRYGTDYADVRHDNITDEDIERFFIGDVARASFPNTQHFDFEGVRGRLLSSSYVPGPGHPNHGPILDAVARLFEAHQQGGRVVFEYETRVYCGPVA